MASNTTFTSMLAGSKFASAAGLPPQVDYVIDAVTSVGPWTLLLTVFAMCVVYDQGKHQSNHLYRISQQLTHMSPSQSATS